MLSHQEKRDFDVAFASRPSDPLANGFREAWSKLHPCLRAALATGGFPLGDYADARALADAEQVTEEVLKEIETSAVQMLPPTGAGRDKPQIIKDELSLLVSRTFIKNAA